MKVVVPTASEDSGSPLRLVIPASGNVRLVADLMCEVFRRCADRDVLALHGLAPHTEDGFELDDGDVLCDVVADGETLVLQSMCCTVEDGSSGNGGRDARAEAARSRAAAAAAEAREAADSAALAADTQVAAKQRELDGTSAARQRSQAQVQAALQAEKAAAALSKKAKRAVAQCPKADDAEGEARRAEATAAAAEAKEQVETASAAHRAAQEALVACTEQEEGAARALAPRRQVAVP